MERKTWIPVDVKVHWFSFLSAKDLGTVSRVCRAWVSLASKTCDANVAVLTGATPPSLSRAAKLKFYHRLQNATAPENMGYLLSWAAGSREYTPFLHKLLLLRDTIREDFGLPGGLHDAARPDAYADADEDVRALFTYRADKGADLVHQPPLLVAASRGNVDAVHLLLLFGEGVHARRKGNDKALYVAVEQGNVAMVAALLGRVPLRPPQHPQHIARRLGLIRPVYDVYGPGRVYVGGVGSGPRSVPAAIAGARMRAELAAATGFNSTATGQVRASATAAFALAKTVGMVGDGGVIASPVEAAVAQAEIFESDGRYRAWCRGYAMGTYWSTYDTAMAAWEALHGPLGGGIGGYNVLPSPQPLALAPTAAAAAGAPAGRARPWAAPPAGSTPTVRAERVQSAASALIHTTLRNLPERLAMGVVPGSTVHGSSTGIVPAFVHQAALVSRLPPSAALAAVSRPRPRGIVHPRLPPPFDHGELASQAIALRVRLNVGPVDKATLLPLPGAAAPADGGGRTPLWAATELGRLECAYLLLSHHNPAAALAAEVPELPVAEEADVGGPGLQAAAGAGGPPAAAAAPVAEGAAAPAAGAVAAAPVVAAPVDPAAVAAAAIAAAARAALSAIAGMSAPALAVPPEYLLQGSGEVGGRREEMLVELLGGEVRDRVDVEACPPGAHTPLCLAAERGDPLLVSLLLHWGADVNRPGKKDAPPVLVAAMAHQEGVLKVLLRAASAAGPAKEVATVIDALRADKAGWGGGMGDSDVEGEATPMVRAAQSSSVFALLGLQSSALAMRSLGAAVRAAPFLRSILAGCGSVALRRTLSEGFGDYGKGSGGTAATNAMGSAIARQRGGKGKATREREGLPESLPLDLCEPSVVAALAGAATVAAAAAVDDFSLLTTPAAYSGASLAPPLDMSLYLPADEAGAGVAREGPSGAVPRSTSRPRAGSNRSSITGKAGAQAAAVPETDASEGDAAEVLCFSTSSSYVTLAASVEAYKASVRGLAASLARRSRACAGVGALAGRPVLDVNIGDESGYTPLFILASAGRLETVMLLIAAGADPTLPTKRGKTAIYGAVEKAHEEVVSFLMTRYTATQLRANTTYGTNVIHAANKAGNSKIRDMLTTYCVDYDARASKTARCETVARRKAQWGEEGAGGNEGEGLAVGGAAAEALRKLRAAAEAAKKREIDAVAARRAGARGLSIGPLGGGEDSDGGEEPPPTPRDARGRSPTRRRPSIGASTATGDEGGGGKLDIAVGNALSSLQLSPYKVSLSKAARAASSKPTPAGKPPKAAAPAARAASSARAPSRGSTTPRRPSVSSDSGSVGVPTRPVLSRVAATPGSPLMRSPTTTLTGPPSVAGTSPLSSGSAGTASVHASENAPPAASAAAPKAGGTKGPSKLGPGGLQNMQGSPVAAGAAGSTVFERLVARGKELEAKKKAQEEELGGAAAAVRKAAAAFAATVGPNVALASSPSAAPAPALGARPAYLRAAEAVREKAERSATAGSASSDGSLNSSSLGTILAAAAAKVAAKASAEKSDKVKAGLEKERVAKASAAAAAAADRAKRSSYFERLLGPVGAPSATVEPATGTLALPTSSASVASDGDAPIIPVHRPEPVAAAPPAAVAPRPSASAVGSSAASSFVAGAVAFASRKAELDTLLEAMDRKEGGSPAGGVGRMRADVVPPPPPSAASGAKAIKAKTSLLGLGLGLASPSSAAPTATTTSPLHGLLTRGLSLGLGQPKAGSAASALRSAKGERGLGQVEVAGVAGVTAPTPTATPGEEAAAREERNRAREAARVARIAQAREEAAAKAREQEEGVTAAAAKPDTLQLAVSAYAMALPKRKGGKAK